MKAFILAGGEGTRLRPITYEIPKPLIPVHKKAILSHLVELFERHGVDHFLISINAKHAADFEKWRAGEHAHQNIEFIIENSSLGTFGSLYLAKPHLSSESFFMSNGDELKGFDLAPMLSHHRAHKPIATLGLINVDDPHHYGVAVCDGPRIERFLEKPENPPASTISCGLYLMDPKVFDHYPHPDARFAMVEQDLFPKLVEKKMLHGYTLEGQWYDCGTLERWEKAIHEWKGLPS